MRVNRNTPETRQWLGVAYAHIPTRGACRPFSRLMFRLEKLLRKR